MSENTKSVRWLVPALGHNEGDVTNEPSEWVDKCGLPACLVEMADSVKGTKATPVTTKG